MALMSSMIDDLETGWEIPRDMALISPLILWGFLLLPSTSPTPVFRMLSQYPLMIIMATSSSIPMDSGHPPRTSRDATPRRLTSDEPSTSDMLSNRDLSDMEPSESPDSKRLIVFILIL